MHCWAIKEELQAPPMTQMCERLPGVRHRRDSKIP